MPPAKALRHAIAAPTKLGAQSARRDSKWTRLESGLLLGAVQSEAAQEHQSFLLERSSLPVGKSGEFELDFDLREPGVHGLALVPG